MPCIRDQLMALAQKYLTAFNTNTPEGVIAHRSADCKHYILPTAAGQPVRNNTEYQAFIAPSFKYIKDFFLKIDENFEPIIDEKSLKVSMWLTTSADSVIGPYNNQYNFVLYANSNVSEIIQVVEFIDTQVTGDFLKRLMNYIAEHSDA